MTVITKGARDLLQHVVVHVLAATIAAALLLMWLVPLKLWLQLFLAWVAVALARHFVKKAATGLTISARIYLGSLVVVAAIATGAGMTLGVLQKEDMLTRLDGHISRTIALSPAARRHPFDCASCPNIWRDVQQKLLVTSAVEGPSRFTVSFRELLSRALDDPRIVWAFVVLCVLYVTAALFSAFYSVVSLLSSKRTNSGTQVATRPTAATPGTQPRAPRGRGRTRTR
jgi:hypothetical protein